MKTVKGTMSYNTGNTFMELTNSITGNKYEYTLLEGSCSFPNLSNSYIAVKAYHYSLLEKKCMEYGFKPWIEMSVANVRSMLYNLKLGKGLFLKMR